MSILCTTYLDAIVMEILAVSKLAGGVVLVRGQELAHEQVFDGKVERETAFFTQAMVHAAEVVRHVVGNDRCYVHNIQRCPSHQTVKKPAVQGRDSPDTTPKCPQLHTLPTFRKSAFNTFAWFPLPQLHRSSVCRPHLRLHHNFAQPSSASSPVSV